MDKVFGSVIRVVLLITVLGLVVASVTNKTSDGKYLNPASAINDALNIQP